jgi:enoyl-CoA hydratase/carnithine racemase
VTATAAAPLRSDWTALDVRHDPQEGLLRLQIDNPPLGLLNQVVRQELGSLFLAAGDRADVRCILFGSSERSFCAGADLREYPLRFDPRVARAHVDNAHRMILALAECDVPVIAELRGACMGGGFELALGCGYRVAASSASFALPEVKRGAWPGTGGTALLARLVSPSVARRLLYTGETLTAARALELGLVDEVVEDGLLQARCEELARAFASQPRSSIRTMSQLLDRQFRASLRDHLRHEAECFVTAYQLPTAREGYTAFFEKRAPRWPRD